MSKYTSGEIAKLCGVSVRTVQYYDSRNILMPSCLSEGGRRLYSEEDLKRLRIICFLRETGFPISSISRLLTEEHPEKIISVLLEQQEQALCEEIAAKQKKLRMIEGIKRELKGIDKFSVASIGDIAYLMKNEKKLKQMRLWMVLSGIPLSLLQIGAILLWIGSGQWWLFVLWACFGTAWAIVLSQLYFTHVAYLCHECHEVFRPTFKEIFWAYHTPKMRRLTCPKCGSKGLRLEVYQEK